MATREEERKTAAEWVICPCRPKLHPCQWGSEPELCNQIEHLVCTTMSKRRRVDPSPPAPFSGQLPSSTPKTGIRVTPKPERPRSEPHHCSNISKLRSQGSQGSVQLQAVCCSWAGRGRQSRDRNAPQCANTRAKAAAVAVKGGR